MKIIAGKYKGRNIPVVGRTRPPLVRTRTNIFDLISVTDLKVLDLCAGSGSLGLEAISRGADEVFFFEEKWETAQNLINTLKMWQINNGYVVISNAEYLPQAKVKVDLIFLDPPFGHNNLERIAARIIQKGWTHKNTILVLRTDHKPTKIDGWQLYNLRKSGVSYVGFCQPEPSKTEPQDCNDLESQL
jgi:16S rRNA (guanine966-N2)-methyltransferase